MTNKNPRISLIAALGKNREIGKDNQLLWNIPEDLRRFKRITMGAPIIMGQKTFESLPFALPQRLNIVLTQDKLFNAPGAQITFSIPQALQIAKKEHPMEIFFVGGGSVYKQTLRLADRLYLTLVDKEFPQADTFFPNYQNFKRVIYRRKSRDQNYRYEFLILER